MINRMRKGIIKIVVLILVFCLTVVAMGGRDRQSEMNLTSEMASVTLPVVCLQRGDMRMNQLYGYRTEMDAAAMRDTITPLGEDLSLPLLPSSSTILATSPRFTAAGFKAYRWVSRRRDLCWV